MNIPRARLAAILLGLYLIILGGATLLHLTFEGITIVEGVLALIAGILFLIG